MITKKNNEDAKFVSAWMDRCHELELEIAKLKSIVNEQIYKRQS